VWGWRITETTLDQLLSPYLHQGRKSARSTHARPVEHSAVLLGSRGWEFCNHFHRTFSLGPFLHRRASFLITDSLVQNDPNQPTKPMGNRSDGWSVSWPWL
jgi:hypothetical protein